jgi:hypothetical protein
MRRSIQLLLCSVYTDSFLFEQANGDPLPPPVVSAPDDSLIPCPHCNRRFNQKAADRHIPQCQNIKGKSVCTSLLNKNSVDEIKSKSRYSCQRNLPH